MIRRRAFDARRRCLAEVVLAARLPGVALVRGCVPSPIAVEETTRTERGLAWGSSRPLPWFQTQGLECLRQARPAMFRTAWPWPCVLLGGACQNRMHALATPLQYYYCTIVYWSLAWTTPVYYSVNNSSLLVSNFLLANRRDFLVSCHAIAPQPPLK